MNNMEGNRSTLFRVTNCPVPTGYENRHEGLDFLLDLMWKHGLNLYRTDMSSELGGPLGLINESDVVLIKVNAQWKYRGCTNSDLVRGLIQRILEHPDGFEGEIVIFENGQSEGSLDCDSMCSAMYPDTGVHANAEDESHSFSYMVDHVFKDQRVSKYLLDPIMETFISKEEHSVDGYRKSGIISYPCFTTKKGNRIELKEGIWNGSSYDQNLKLINIPVLKHHDGCGITGALKSFFGVLSMADGKKDERHYEKVGQHCGEMIVNVRAPILNILDCIWVTQVRWAGYPPEHTTKLNQVLASVDPVALDYWASKYLLYPIDANEEHHPDKFAGLRDKFTQAKEVINNSGGINGHKVTFDEYEIDIHSRNCSS
jgi:uncharacterized protein (DUF362 family)